MFGVSCLALISSFGLVIITFLWVKWVNQATFIFNNVAEAIEMKKFTNSLNNPFLDNQTYQTIKHEESPS